MTETPLIRTDANQEKDGRLMAMEVEIHDMLLVEIPCRRCGYDRVCITPRCMPLTCGWCGADISRSVSA